MLRTSIWICWKKKNRSKLKGEKVKEHLPTLYKLRLDEAPASFVISTNHNKKNNSQVAEAVSSHELFINKFWINEGSFLNLKGILALSGR